MGCRGAWNIAIKQFGGLNLGGFPLILGIVLCIFNSVKRETDSLGGVEPLNAPMLRRVDSFLLFLLSRLKEFSSHCFRIQVYHIIFGGCRQSPPSVDVWPILKRRSDMELGRIDLHSGPSPPERRPRLFISRIFMVAPAESNEKASLC